MSFLRTFWVAAALLAGPAMSMPAMAQNADDIYWGLALGPYFTYDNEAGDADVEFDTGIVGAAQIGYVFETVRADLEFEYSRADIDEIGNANANADLQTYRGTLGLYSDCPDLFKVFTEWLANRLEFLKVIQPTCVDIVPYGGLGLGVAHQDLNGDLDDERTSFTAHLETGLSFASNRHLQLGLAYRWTWFENDLEGLDDEALSHQIRIGARFFY